MSTVMGVEVTCTAVMGVEVTCTAVMMSRQSIHTAHYCESRICCKILQH